MQELLQRYPRHGRKACLFCEAAVQPEPTELEKRIVYEILIRMSPELLAKFEAAKESTNTVDDSLDRLFVRDCPKCGSEDTGSCYADPEIEEVQVGRCYECGQLWCTTCRRLLERDAPSCECWEAWRKLSIDILDHERPRRAPIAFNLDCDDLSPLLAEHCEVLGRGAAAGRKPHRQKNDESHA